MINKDSKINKNSDITAVRMGEEISMLDVESGNYYVLSSMGAVIWEILDGEKHIDEIVSSLIEEYDVDRETCESEVIRYLNDLENKKLIQVVR